MQIGKLSNVLDISAEQADNCHGKSDKDMIVLHETVSPDYVGWADVKSVSAFLDSKDYGIHGIVDKEGNVAWSYGLGRCIFYHTASEGHNVNTRSIGIENVSNVMLLTSDNTARWNIWWARDAQIEALAKLIAWVSDAHDIPLVVSDGNTPGVTTHWQVTQKFNVPGGHVDCWPRHLGGYFPLLRVIQRARDFKTGV